MLSSEYFFRAAGVHCKAINFSSIFCDIRFHRAATGMSQANTVRLHFQRKRGNADARNERAHFVGEPLA